MSWTIYTWGPDGKRLVFDSRASRSKAFAWSAVFPWAFIEENAS